MLLWYGDGGDDAISVGPAIEAWKAFGEISEAIEGAEEFDELQSVPGFAEQMVTPWWLGQVRDQARTFLSEFGDTVSEYAQSVARNLAIDIDEIKGLTEQIGKDAAEPGP